MQRKEFYDLKEDKDYIKLWNEYATLVSDPEEVYTYMIETLQFTDYRIFITFAKWKEQYHRNFR